MSCSYSALELQKVSPIPMILWGLSEYRDKKTEVPGTIARENKDFVCHISWGDQAKWNCRYKWKLRTSGTINGAVDYRMDFWSIWSWYDTVRCATTSVLETTCILHLGFGAILGNPTPTVCYSFHWHSTEVQKLAWGLNILIMINSLE